jgi:hypothetical protein
MWRRRMLRQTGADAGSASCLPHEKARSSPAGQEVKPNSADPNGPGAGRA